MAPYSDYYDPVALPSSITPTASPHLSMWSKSFINIPYWMNFRKSSKVGVPKIYVANFGLLIMKLIQHCKFRVQGLWSHFVTYKCCGEVHHKIMRITASTCYRSESITLYHGFSQIETSFHLMHDMIE